MLIDMIKEFQIMRTNDTYVSHHIDACISKSKKDKSR